MAGRSALFSSLVVIGASLTNGCGGDVRTGVSRAGPGSGAGGADGDAGAGNGDASVRGGAGGGPAADAAPDAVIPVSCPTQRIDCTCHYHLLTPPLEYSCTPASRQPQDPIQCTCRDSGPLVPTDCAETAQFTCVGWDGAGTSCTCDPTAPLTAADCAPGLYFTCWKDAPPVGCRCIVGIR